MVDPPLADPPPSDDPPSDDPPSIDTHSDATTPISDDLPLLCPPA